MYERFVWVKSESMVFYSKKYEKSEDKKNKKKRIFFYFSIDKDCYLGYIHAPVDDERGRKKRRI